MTADADTTTGDDLDGFRPVIPANRYYLDHMLKHVERCIDAVDTWIVERKEKRGLAIADIASGEQATVPDFDLPELLLPASVHAYLPVEDANEVTSATINDGVQTARSKCESIETPQELAAFIQNTENQIEHLVRVYVRPYERLRLEIWTRLQQLDLRDLPGGIENPPNLVDLPDPRSIDQMIDQWFDADPRARIQAFDVSGPLGLTANLVYRTVTRKGFGQVTVDFGSMQAGWLPFIIAFFAGRNGVTRDVAEQLYDRASKTKSGANARKKAIESATRKLLYLKVRVTTNWALKSIPNP